LFGKLSINKKPSGLRSVVGILNASRRRQDRVKKKPSPSERGEPTEKMFRAEGAA
jgi:hypothetical protein